MGRIIKGKKQFKRTISLNGSRTEKKKKKELSRPKGITITNDGNTIISTHDETFKSNLRRSFRELSKGKDSKREFGASYDFIGNTDVFKDVDISRGKTGAENPDNRASVRIRQDKNDEFVIHNHPAENHPSDNWDRPSGADIGNLIWKTQPARDYKARSAFIQQPDGRLIRYSIIDKGKAFNAYVKADEDFQNLSDLERQEWNGSVDWKIESQMQDIRKDERQDAQRLTNPKRDKAQKKLFDKFTGLDELLLKKEQKEFARAIKTNPDGTINDKDFNKQQNKLNKLGKERDDLFSQFEKEDLILEDKFKPIKGKKFIEKRTNESTKKFERRKGLLIERRIFGRFKKFMNDEFGIAVVRMPKNLNKDLIITRGLDKLEIELI